MASKMKFADALGWFSLGLGFAALTRPHEVGRLIGLPDDDPHRQVLMAVGLREIASGVGILMSPDPTGWLWARTAGDIMDLSLLSAALTADQSQRDRVASTTAAILGITAIDYAASQQASRLRGDSEWSEEWNGGRPQKSKAPAGGPRPVRKSITINRPAQELYSYWRNFENLPGFMKHVEDVQVQGDGLRSHWKVKAPAGTSVEWDAEIVDDQPGQRIVWRSLENADVRNAGTVEFFPATDGRGTVVRVELSYDPPGGAVGVAIAKILGEEPEIQVQEDLRRFKQIMETGEIVVSDGTVNRADRLLFSGERPAQPPSDRELSQSDSMNAQAIAPANQPRTSSENIPMSVSTGA